MPGIARQIRHYHVDSFGTQNRSLCLVSRDGRHPHTTL